MESPKKSELHIWHTDLRVECFNETSTAVLSGDELHRAERYRLAQQRKTFITTRAVLRSILSLYLKINPQNILLSQTANGKLYIPDSKLQFNLSHSHGFAVYAFTYEYPVGIDIEKERSGYKEKVAQRFFSAEEYTSFSALPSEEKVAEFYKIWTCKEAVIKGLGEKISSLPLASFNVSHTPVHVRNKDWHVKNIDFFLGYSLAVATVLEPTHISYWEWSANGPQNQDL